jgi:hypothetical protein
MLFVASFKDIYKLLSVILVIFESKDMKRQRVWNWESKEGVTITCA